ncbi:MAG: family hydrolase [Belnapia sp.]|nr:family hydrolase [Belnapia sp.]
MRPALFLDRDGVINLDHGYVHRAEQVDFVPGIFDLGRAAVARGMPLVVVTNQAGIGRGLYTEADFHRLMDWMRGIFAAAGAPILAVEFCPDHPQHGLGGYRRENPRRKPGPGMILDAAAAHGLDLAGSVLVGDRATDAEAARRAGIGAPVLVTEDPAEAALAPPGTRVLPSVAMAAAWLATWSPSSTPASPKA